MSFDVTGKEEIKLVEIIAASEDNEMSKTQIRTLIKQGGVTVSISRDEEPDPITHEWNWAEIHKPTDPDVKFRITPVDVIKIKVGKRRWLGVERWNLEATENEPRLDILLISHW
jgi:hypothetical protein